MSTNVTDLTRSSGPAARGAISNVPTGTRTTPDGFPVRELEPGVFEVAVSAARSGERGRRTMEQIEERHERTMALQAQQREAVRLRRRREAAAAVANTGDAPAPRELTFTDQAMIIGQGVAAGALAIAVALAAHWLFSQ